MSLTEGKLDRVYLKNFGMCRSCGKRLVREMHGAVGHPDEWQVDHDIPKSRGGSNNIDNLWPMCAACNRDKADLTGEEYRLSKMFPGLPATMFGGR